MVVCAAAEGNRPCAYPESANGGGRGILNGSVLSPLFAVRGCESITAPSSTRAWLWDAILFPSFGLTHPHHRLRRRSRMGVANVSARVANDTTGIRSSIGPTPTPLFSRRAGQGRGRADVRRNPLARAHANRTFHETPPTRFGWCVTVNPYYQKSSHAETCCKRPTSIRKRWRCRSPRTATTLGHHVSEMAPGVGLHIRGTFVGQQTGAGTRVPCSTICDQLNAWPIPLSHPPTHFVGVRDALARRPCCASGTTPRHQWSSGTVTARGNTKHNHPNTNKYTGQRAAQGRNRGARAGGDETSTVLSGRKRGRCGWGHTKKRTSTGVDEVGDCDSLAELRVSGVFGGLRASALPDASSSLDSSFFAT